MRPCSAAYVGMLLFPLLGLSGCGGGGGGGDDAPAATSAEVEPTTPPPVSGTPTATLQSSQAQANALVALGRSGANTVAKTSMFAKAGAAAIAGITASTQQTVVNCAYGGKVTATPYRRVANSAAPDWIDYTPQNCAYSPGALVSGTWRMTFLRYVSLSDFQANSDYVNMTASGPGYAFGPASLSVQADVSANRRVYTTVADNRTLVGDIQAVNNGSVFTVQSGVLRAYLGSNWVEIRYSSFTYDIATGRPVSGTMTLTGRDGAGAVVTATTGGYKVAITAGGVTSSFDVAI